MALNREVRLDNKSRIVWLLVLAAALPLTGVGMFAGAILALMVGFWLLRAGRDHVVNWELLMGLTGLALVLNLVFSAGFFGAFS